ncbi:hypothetical protein GOODEAATRI_024742, partial [Goodea atripinnis]
PEDSAAETFSSAESSGDEYVCNEQPDSDDSFSESELLDMASSNLEGDQTRHSSDDSDSDAPAKDPAFTNKNYCFVCGRPQTKISRHLFTHRKEEPEIAEAFALRRNSKERKKLLDKLRNRGNYNHNQEVLKTRKGKLKLRRRTNMSTAENSATCIYCKALFSRKILWRHLLKCPSRISAPLEGRTQILALVASGLTDPENKSSGVRKVLKKLKDDETRSFVLQDPYILRLACCLYYLNKAKNKDKEINRKLRQMGRLLGALKEKSIMSFEEALKPKNFDSIVEAMRKVSTLNKDNSSKRLSKTVAYSLKKVAHIKYALALSEKGDKEAIEEAKEFVQLCEKEWVISKPAQREIPGTATVPFIQDVQMLFKYINNSVTSAVKTLTKFESPPVYTALLKVVSAYLAILNRNVGEVCHVSLQSFQQRNETPPQEDAEAKQQPFEKILSKRLVKISVANQKNQKVVLSLTPDLLSAITMLVERRKPCGVADGNPYLFGRPGASSSITCRGQQNVSVFVNLCGANSEANLRSPFFRKHTARIFHILILNNEELSQLATLLGRDLRTESEFYQTPQAAGDIAKILVLLSAVEGECLDIFQGKSLEEIEIPDVFCSKDCLFEMFSPSKAASRTCYYCFREISQPLDLIMAVVDLKGTMKDFCSPTCLCSFKSHSPSVKTQQSLQRNSNSTSTQTLSPLCSMCNKTCTNIMAAHECPVCQASQLPSDMVNYKNENIVDLFCSRYCDSNLNFLIIVKKQHPSSLAVEMDDTARLIIGSDDVTCCCCSKRLKKASKVYHLKKAKQVFCSESCVTEKHPHVQFDTKKCYNCLQ